jgi:hypothetical protein
MTVAVQICPFQVQLCSLTQFYRTPSANIQDTKFHTHTKQQADSPSDISTVRNQADKSLSESAGVICPSCGERQEVDWRR